MSNYRRILGLDYGTVRVGVAISDLLGFLARRLETIERKGNDEIVLNRIRELAADYKFQEIVLGLPLRTDDLPGERERDTRRFGQLLEDEGYSVIYQDERYTSIIAEEIMRETKVKPQERKGLVDQIAAEIILQDYLNRQGSH